MPNASEVRPALGDEIPELVRMLSAAFQDDPLMEWLWPDPHRRAHGLPDLFTANIRHQHVPLDGVDIVRAASGSIGGGALWCPPGKWKPGPLTELRMLPLLARGLRARLLAGKRLSDAMGAVHPAEPHWYLATIGTDPAQRGSGFGRALLQARLAHCDREGLGAYLESSKEANIAYYQRFGFEVTVPQSVPGGGPAIWPMWREPRPPP